ncbi:MAG TPA: GatB/YqeY domain-containing protein [Acidimicrobiia bacterium]|nr:GatB/YqeY domain-containing protein [Acidimicrobiia bacterium]
MRDRLKADLANAMRNRDRPRINVLRSALSAIDNAEAVATTGSSEGTIGYADVARRSLDEAEVVELIADEISERETSASHYLELGLTEQARRLRDEADILRAYLGDA